MVPAQRSIRRTNGGRLTRQLRPNGCDRTKRPAHAQDSPGYHILAAKVERTSQPASYVECPELGPWVDLERRGVDHERLVSPLSWAKGIPVVTGN